jgi:DNA primase
MRKALANAQPLADMLWAGETEGRDFSTPERRAGLEAELDRMIKAIRDGKIADYYRRDFADRVFKAFKQRRPAPGKSPGDARRSGRRQLDRRPGARVSAPPIQANVSAAVKRSLLVVNALSGGDQKQREHLLGQLICTPEQIHSHAEELASLALDDPLLDRVRRELLNVAASGKRLDKTAVENHLVRQGLGALAERLKTQSVLQSDLKGQADEESREALWLRTREKLANPDVGRG